MYLENLFDNSFLVSSIETYLNTYWLYHNDYDDLKTVLEDKAYDGMLSFEDGGRGHKASGCKWPLEAG